jgi:hypothetical protein
LVWAHTECYPRYRGVDDEQLPDEMWCHRCFGGVPIGGRSTPASKPVTAIAVSSPRSKPKGGAASSSPRKTQRLPAIVEAGPTHQEIEVQADKTKVHRKIVKRAEKRIMMARPQFRKRLTMMKKR